MNWTSRNVIAPLGLVFALVATGLNVAAYYYASLRDEQARAVPLRLERGQADLAEQHERGAKALGELSAVLVEIGYILAVAALVFGTWPFLTGAGGNRWLAGVTAFVLAAAAALAVASRPN